MCLKYKKIGARDMMAHQLRVVFALSENSGSVSSMWMITPVAACPKASSGSHGHQTHMWHIYMHIGKHIYT